MKDNKQNKPTFADRARKLQQKYSKAAWDKLEADELEAEMEKLQAEQEAVREMLGLNQQEQPMQEFGNGGKLMMAGDEVTQFIPPTEPLLYRTNNNSLTDKVAYADWTGVNKMYNNPTVPLDTKTLAPMTTLNDEQISSLQSQINPTVSDKQSFLNKNKQYLPYAISGASNIASNLLLAAMAKKNQTKINPVLVTPTQINMEPQAEQMRKDASVSKNIGMKQARDLGLNAGATLANMGAIGSGVDRQLGSNLTNLYGQQEQYNVGANNQFALQNQDVANRANMVNAQFEQQANQDRLGYIGGALGTIPGVMKDIRADKADKEMRSIMGSYYKNIGGKNYEVLGDIFEEGGNKFMHIVKRDSKGNPTIEKLKVG